MIKIFGINKKTNSKAYQKFGLNQNLLSSSILLNTWQKRKFNDFFKNKPSNNLLKTLIKKNIDFIIKNKTFKGLRHKNNYPTRGQRTHTNGKTRNKKKA